MTIDIIDIYDPKYADLNAAQLALVRKAQLKKNEILAKAEKQIRTLLFHLIENRNARTSAREREESTIYEKANEEVDAVREDLLWQIAYGSQGGSGNENGPYRYPENPNYDLTYSQRFLVVREYYMKISDPKTRLLAYQMDDLARDYLGQYYVTLHDLLASYVKTTS